MKRREFLRLAGAGVAAGATGAAAAHEFVPYIVGANTAITGYGLYESIGLLRAIGFPAIEVQNLVGVPEPAPGKFPGFRLDEISDAEKPKIKQALAGFDFVTTHLPYTGLEYFAPTGPAADEGIRTFEMAMRATGFLEAKIAVMHPKPGPDMTLEETWPIMLRRIRRWGDMARDMGFRLALETGYPQSVRDFVRLVQEVDHENVGAIIDVGHQGRYAELVARVKPEERATPAGIKAYNDTTLEIVERLGPKVIHFHVHDIEPETWREHQPLIHGFVDYPRLIAKLREIRYGGALVFEIGGPPEQMPGWLSDGKRKLEGYLAG